MPEEPVESTFDDPGLKTAVRRALAKESNVATPPALRDRISTAIAAELKPTVVVPAPFWRRHLLAIAAVLVLCVGGGVMWAVLGSSNSNPLPETFAAALVVRHDICCAEPDHHVLKGVPDDDFRLMTQKLREKLGFPVLAAAAGDGWTFHGASAKCTVAGMPCSHLVFAKADEHLSIFSTPTKETWPNGNAPADGTLFKTEQNAHAIIGWIHGDVMFSVVASNSAGEINTQDITPIADRLRIALAPFSDGTAYADASH